MGWNRASTFNLNIRYVKQSLALLAQAATPQLRRKLPKPYSPWTAAHAAQQVLTNMKGDIRVEDDTIIVTYYRDHQNLLEAIKTLTAIGTFMPLFFVVPF